MDIQEVRGQQEELSAGGHEATVAIYDASAAPECSHLSEEQWMTQMKRQMSQAMEKLRELQASLDAFCQERCI
eukprot:7303556-Prorocentrum_lima.AAC.1